MCLCKEYLRWIVLSNFTWFNPSRSSGALLICTDSLGLAPILVSTFYLLGSGPNLPSGHCPRFHLYHLFPGFPATHSFSEGTLGITPALETWICPLEPSLLSASVPRPGQVLRSLCYFLLHLAASTGDKNKNKTWGKRLGQVIKNQSWAVFCSDEVTLSEQVIFLCP